MCTAAEAGPGGGKMYRGDTHSSLSSQGPQYLVPANKQKHLVADAGVLFP